MVCALTFPMIPSAPHSSLTDKMALHRSSSSKGSRADAEKDDEDMDNNGYVQIFVKPLEQGDYSVILRWLGLSTTKLTRQQVGLATGACAVLGSVLLYQLIVADIGTLFHRLAALVVPIFAIASAFFWLALHLRKTWTTTSVYILFTACFFSEFVGQCLVDTAAGGMESDSFIARPVLALLVLIAVSGASVFSSLETGHSTAVIVFISVVRFLAATTLADLPQSLRPFIAYMAGLTGVIGAKYLETLFKPPVTNYMTNDGKIPVIKRRRSSASAMHGFSNTHRSGRRTSLPALIHSKSQVRCLILH